MDKSLLDIMKIPQADQKKSADAAALPAVSAAPVSVEAWQEDKTPWRDSPQGRAAIRLFSRGILGAAFFAWGGKYARKVDPLTGKAEGMFGYEHSFEKGVINPWNIRENIKSPLKLIARAVDVCVASPLKSIAHIVTGDEKLAERFVRFRPMSVKFRDNKHDFAHGGRSLGEEVVGITFDFFSASVGDALGRDIADAVDPNVKKDWLDDKGHIKPEVAVKNAGKAAWRYLTYNGGEDWAVAIPYAYFMKGQRNILNKLSPGFKYDANENNNGAAFRISTEGGKTKVIGNYNATGIFDLQSRFTVYNMGTLLYREAYDWVGNMLQGHPTHIYGAPDDNRGDRTIGQKAEDVAKWVTRGVVKGFIYMTPAVPFFWITRTPQTAYKATFIDPKHGAVLDYKTNQKHPDGADKYTLIKPLLTVREEEQKIDFLRDKTPVYLHKFTGNLDFPRGWEPVAGPRLDLNPLRGGFDYHQTHGIVDSALRPFGRVSDGIRRNLRDMGKPFGIKPMDMSRFVNASIAYTPYMYMKGETGKAWDTGKMDLAAERMIDGLFAGKGSEFKAGLGEVWRTILGKPWEDAAREREGDRRIEVDTSAADSELLSHADEHLLEAKEARKNAPKLAAEHQAHPEQPAQPAQPVQNPVTFTSEPSTSIGAVTPAAHMDGLSWEERAIQGRKESKKQDPIELTAKLQISHAEREKMRDFLAQAVPPTKSIN